MGEVNKKGFSKMPVANAHSVGMQGSSGSGQGLGGSEIMGVKPSPMQKTAKKTGGGMGPLAQGPIQPKVGK